jgi:DNA replication protein DnaC
MAKKAGKPQRQRPMTVGPEMIVFVSWSKDSQKAAKLFCDWLPKVIQQVNVWQSEQIESGSKWFTILSERLSEIHFGVSVVTKNNYKEPWLQFEAGALAKALHSKVTPIFCNLSPLDVVHTPLEHLQGIKVDRDTFWKLISDVNAICPKPLDLQILEDSFDKRWPEFENAFKEIEFESDAEVATDETETEKIARIENVLEAILRSSNETTETLNTLLRVALSQIERDQTVTPTGSSGNGGYGTGSWGYGAGSSRPPSALAKLIALSREGPPDAGTGGTARSFVIYGEPQSGKTEMMICLTAKLIDAGFGVVIHLLNDSVQLLQQNLERFQRSGLSPSARNFSEVMDPSISLRVGQHVIFCKKNPHDFRKLNENWQPCPPR